MSKAFTRETEADNDFAEEDASPLPPLPVGSKNYITPGGHQRLMDEFHWLMNKERPQVTATVARGLPRTATGRRMRDYIYGKKRCVKSTGATSFFTRRLTSPKWTRRRREMMRRGFFSRHGDACEQAGEEKSISIVGVDEIDTARGYISYAPWRAR